jgi:putative ABC transport system substrate-binding protein
MKKTLSLILAVLMVLSVAVFATSCNKSNSKYTVGIWQLVQHPALDEAQKDYMDAINEEMGEGAVEYLNENASNDP